MQEFTQKVGDVHAYFYCLDPLYSNTTNATAYCMAAQKLGSVWFYRRNSGWQHGMCVVCIHHRSPAKKATLYTETIVNKLNRIDNHLFEQ